MTLVALHAQIRTIIFLICMNLVKENETTIHSSIENKQNPKLIYLIYCLYKFARHTD